MIDLAVVMNDILTYIEKRPSKTATREEIRLAFIKGPAVPDDVMNDCLDTLVKGRCLIVDSYKMNPRAVKEPSE